MGKNIRPIEIFLADDDADDRKFFSEALAATEIVSTLTTVENGLMLTELLNEIEHPPPPDIIFLDINMPYKDGKVCLREIRSNQKFRNIPVIMISTSAYKNDIEETYRDGANMYLPKAAFYEDEVNILNHIFSSDWTKKLINVPKEKYVVKK